ncbi:MAG: enoyl-CoA hydratase/isomerase family protein [Burkholderiales bacterium]|nr:enoyl-CoA hydratase/isomerase family protein [Burkholderiales bacterium]
MTTTLFEVHGAVATLTLNQPARRNPLDADTKQGLAEALAEMRRRSDLRALVIAGRGGVFSAGGDLRGMQGTVLDSAGWRERMASLHREVFAPLIALDRPVIAAVDGAAYGAGFSLALAADFVLASTRARFCMSFLRVGLVPDGGAWYTLPRVVGAQRAKELMLSAREVGAAEALRLGIAMELHPPEQLLARAQALAASFSGASALAVGAVKRGVEIGTRSDLAATLAYEADAQALAFQSPEHRSAVERFLAKQPAAFQWPPAAADETPRGAP